MNRPSTTAPASAAAASALHGLSRRIVTSASSYEKPLRLGPFSAKRPGALTTQTLDSMALLVHAFAGAIGKRSASRGHPRRFSEARDLFQRKARDLRSFPSSLAGLAQGGKRLGLGRDAVRLPHAQEATT